MKLLSYKARSFYTKISFLPPRKEIGIRFCKPGAFLSSLTGSGFRCPVDPCIGSFQMMLLSASGHTGYPLVKDLHIIGQGQKPWANPRGIHCLYFRRKARHPFQMGRRTLPRSTAASRTGTSRAAHRFTGQRRCFWKWSLNVPNWAEYEWLSCTKS